MTTFAAIPIGSMPTHEAVGWFTLALINARAAQGQGRSGPAWWALFLLFGPVATFRIMLFNPMRPT